MLKSPEATPCPVVRQSTPLATAVYESTEELNFTIEIQAALKRRRKLVRPQAQPDQTTTQRTAARKGGGVVTVEIPYRHERPERINMAGSRRETTQRALLPSDQQGTFNDAAKFKSQHEDAEQLDTIHMRKKPRRRTIYVPSDNTSILTIHPGLNPEAIGKSDYSLAAITQAEAGRCNLALCGDGQGQRVDKKPLADAPKRFPLQPTLKTLQEVENQRDIIGNGSGKENIPPGIVAPMKENNHKIRGSRARKFSIFGAVPECEAFKPDELPVPSPGQRSKFRLHPVVGEPKTKRTTTRDPRESMMNRRNSLYYGSWKASAGICHDESVTRLPSKLMAPYISDKVTMKGKYSILHEDIDTPEMFENAWLNDQECAIQQLLNGLFGTVSASRASEMVSDEIKRRDLLHLYQGPACSLQYKRVQASLFYGALSAPRNSIADTSGLRCDIGLRQQFLSMWTETYDTETLSAAAQVVIGREIPKTPSRSLDDHEILQAKKSRRKDLEQFLISCLLDNEDAAESERSSPRWCWRRTVLRSLMIVLLLDKAKETKLLPGNIFRTSSKLKSSRGILTELSALLIPSVGDVYRPLSHLDYHLHHTQFPLSEYQYNVTNLATDLRDGVKLTRLLELLLCPPQSLGCVDENVTVALPTGENFLSTVGEGESWVLSQHLKFPCLSKVQKLYNVQIALSALQGIGGLENIADGLRAEDIVDGHREKTVRLLWGIVGRWGLDSLVDFSELRKEIHRLRRDNSTMGSSDSGVDEIEDGDLVEGLENQTNMLKVWAQTIGRRYGLQVHNLTTSFADGRVFSKVIDEYQGLLSCPQSSRSSPPLTSASKRLDTKLKEIGCGASFALIFGLHERERVFHRDFTVAALAFLCSRLLGGSRKGRAAVVIQRAYRKAQMREGIRRRCTLLRIAHDCKAVLATRNRVIGAARIIQRSWRAYVTWSHGNNAVHGGSRNAEVSCKKLGKASQTSDDVFDIWLP